MSTTRTGILAVTIGAAAPLGLAGSAHADASTCDWWIDARPLCMVIEGSITKAQAKNFGTTTKTVRFTMIDSNGWRKWASISKTLGPKGSPTSTTTWCAKSDGKPLFGSADGLPCHVWPNGYSIRLEQLAGGTWERTSGPDIKIQK